MQPARQFGKATPLISCQAPMKRAWRTPTFHGAGTFAPLVHVSLSAPIEVASALRALCTNIVCQTRLNHSGVQAFNVQTFNVQRSDASVYPGFPMIDALSSFAGARDGDQPGTSAHICHRGRRPCPSLRAVVRLCLHHAIMLMKAGGAGAC